jgi:hypothetical protein
MSTFAAGERVELNSLGIPGEIYRGIVLSWDDERLTHSQRCVGDTDAAGAVVPIISEGGSQAILVDKNRLRLLPPPSGVELAAERVRRFLEVRSRQAGVDHGVVHSASSGEDILVELLTSDLEALVWAQLGRNAVTSDPDAVKAQACRSRNVQPVISKHLDERFPSLRGSELNGDLENA